MSAHDGWVYLDDPPQPERRRPATVPELAAHQASCPECRDPWFANPKEPGICKFCDGTGVIYAGNTDAATNGWGAHACPSCVTGSAT